MQERDLRMKDKVKVAVVGLGYVGNIHLEKLTRFNDVEIAAVCDKDKEKAESTALRFGTKYTLNYEDIIKLCDAVIVATNTAEHFRIAMDFINEGKHAFIEKPIATSYSDGMKIVESARRRGIIVQAGHIERFNSAFKYVKKLVKNPGFISGDRLSPFPARSTDVDVILDVMIHDLDVIASMLKSEKVKRVEAVGIPIITDRVDIANVRIEFASGCIANLNASRISYKKMRKLRIFQPDMYVSIDFLERKIEVYRRKFKDGKPEIYGEMKVFEGSDSIEEELRQFITCVKLRKEPEISGEEALKSLYLADRIRESLITPPEGVLG